MPRKKYSNDILAGNNNGGLHSRRKLNTVQQFFNTHDLKTAILYQFILSGADRAEYQATLKALMRHIRTKCRAEYIGAYEVGEEKGGSHAHAFVIVETAEHFPSDLLDVREGGFIARRIKRKAKKAKEAGLDKSLSIRIEPPKNPMHGGAMFAKMNTPAKLADCIKWATYFLKVRSKEDVPGRETYFGSEFLSNIAKREAKRQKYRDALTKSSLPPAVPPAEETVITQTETKEQNEEGIATSYEAGRIAAGGSTEASTEGTSSTAMVGTGCESTEASASSSSSTKAEDQWRRGIGRADTADEEVNLADLIGRPPFRSIGPRGKGIKFNALVNPAVGVYNCLTDVRQFYTTRPTI
ncbi:hypothetical protein ACWV27_23185 [Massilia varians]